MKSVAPCLRAGQPGRWFPKLNVILRKGETIQKELGVLVPLPEDEARISQALAKAARQAQRQ